MTPIHEHPDHSRAFALGANPSTTVEGLQGFFPAAPGAAVSRVPPARKGDFATESPSLRRFVHEVAMQAAGWSAVGLDRLFGSRARGRMGIVTYHRVAAPIAGLPPPTHNVAPERFRSHIAELLRRGFRIWPLRDLLSYNVRGKAVPPRTIALTFDDGFQTVYTRAWPILRELDVPATVFVTTAYLGSSDPFPFDTWGQVHAGVLPPEAYRPLTLAQCHEMAESGLIDIGAHTHTHRNLRGQPALFREDVRLSADFVRAEFGLHDVMFAYPIGSRRLGFAGAEMTVAAREAGVSCGMTTECSLIDRGADPFTWGRFNAFSWDTADTLIAKLDGWYTWAAQCKRFLARCCGFRTSASGK